MEWYWEDVEHFMECIFGSMWEPNPFWKFMFCFNFNRFNKSWIQWSSMTIQHSWMFQTLCTQEVPALLVFVWNCTFWGELHVCPVKSAGEMCLGERVCPVVWHALRNEHSIYRQNASVVQGAYLLTKLLLPTLRSAARNRREPRVVFVSSGGMYNVPFPEWNIATSTPDTDGTCPFYIDSTGNSQSSLFLSSDSLCICVCA